MKTLTLVAMLLLAFVASSLPAEEAEFALEQIVVTATRTAIEILDSPDHVTVITGKEIQESGAANVSEMLGQLAGIIIADSGTEGSVKSIRIRGSASAQVLVLVDSIRLNDSRQGGADLSMIPVENIEKVEILRGGTSALYGADAVGGVINIITKSKADNRFTLTVENGGFLPQAAVEVYEGPVEKNVPANPLDLVDSQKVGVQLSRAFGALDLVATGSFTRAANGFVWMDDQYINDYRRRINADFLRGDAFLSLGVPIGAGRLGFKGQFDYQRAGSPGSIDMFGLSSDAAQQRATFQGHLFFNVPQFLSPVLSLESKLFYKYTRLDYQNPDPMFPADDTHQLHSLGFDLLQELSALDFIHFVYGGNLFYDLANSTQIGQKNRLSGGAFLEAPLYLLPYLTITPMVRYDLYSDFPDSFNFKLSAVYNLSDSASIKASGGKSYRAPTLNDLYWPADLFAAGNPNLRPETGYSGDLGFSLLRKNLQWNLFAFARYILDAIQWAETAPFFYQPLNVGRVFYPGAETDIRLTLFDHFQLSGSYTFLYSFVLEGAIATYSFSDNKRAIYTPVHTFNAAVEYNDGSTMIRVDAGFVGDSYRDEANTTTIDSYLVVNAEVRQKLSSNLIVFVAGKNLLNTVYETVNGYIMPPLSFWLGAELSL